MSAVKSVEELCVNSVPEDLLSGETEICVGHLHDAFKAGHEAAIEQVLELLKQEYDWSKFSRHDPAWSVIEFLEEKLK